MTRWLTHPATRTVRWCEWIPWMSNGEMCTTWACCYCSCYSTVGVVMAWYPQCLSTIHHVWFTYLSIYLPCKIINVWCVCGCLLSFTWVVGSVITFVYQIGSPITRNTPYIPVSNPLSTWTCPSRSCVYVCFCLSHKLPPLPLSGSVCGCYRLLSPNHSFTLLFSSLFPPPKIPEFLHSRLIPIRLSPNALAQWSGKPGASRLLLKYSPAPPPSYLLHPPSTPNIFSTPNINDINLIPIHHSSSTTLTSSWLDVSLPLPHPLQKLPHPWLPRRVPHSITKHHTDASQAEREERDSAKVEPSVTARFFVTTSRVSQSLRSDVSHVVVVSSVSQPVSFHIQSIPRSSCANATCSDLRRDPWCSEDLPRGCYSRCCHIHWARQAQDCHVARRCLRSQETRPHFVRFRWLDMGMVHGSSAMLLTMGAQWEWVLLSGVIVSYGYGGLRHSWSSLTR